MQEIVREEQFYDIDEYLKKPKLSELMQQYIQFKKKYMDCILLCHVGDFFEIYFNDALEMHNKVGLKISKKSCGLDEKVAQCGFPYSRNVNENINNILSRGYKVAICDQLEDPKNKEGNIVKRDVVQVITPGTILDDDLLLSCNNFLASITKNNNSIGFSYVDISTGEIFTSSFDVSLLKEELSRVKPSEIILLDKDLENDLNNIIYNYNIFVNDNFNQIDDNILNLYFSERYLKSLTYTKESKDSLIQLFSYVFYTQKKIAKNLNDIEIYNVHKTMLLDSFTRDSLELTKKQKSNDRQGTLLSVLDKTNTAMGSRKLKQRIEQPFIEKDKIEYELNLVEDLYNDRLLSDNLTSILKNVYDIERICGRLAFEKINPREVVNLKKSIEELPFLKQLIKESNCNYLKSFIEDMDDLSDIFLKLENCLLDNPSFSVNDGNIFKDNYNEKIAKYRKILYKSDDFINDLLEKQKQILGINLLNFGKNNTDGYYICITKKNLEKTNLPKDYKKLKELKSSIYFTCPELKEFEIEQLEAEDKLKKLEYELFVELRDELIDNIFRMKEVSNILAKLDVYLSFSKIAIENNYVRPKLNEENILEIKNGRHPVIEKLSTNPFITNDISMNDNNAIHIITGPNMSGKSTYMRQNALIILMAQIGCFVPCDEANISICDRIFTRIGASDNLLNGESTFMVEMNELSQILNNSTSKSFILLDEVGRGTSTFDGISIAQSTIEYISKNIKCHTLFATHYFELIELENKFSNIENYKVEIEENNEDITFLRKVVKGYSTKSYGIQVAKSVNIPNEVIIRANEILLELENSSDSIEENSTHKNVIVEKVNIREENIDKNKVEIQDDSNIYLEELKNLDLLNLTPMQVLQKVYELQQKVKGN